MTIYLLCPTPSEVRKLQLVLCLSASVVPRVNVLLGIAPIICFLMIGTLPCLGTCPRRVPIFHIESTREAHVHVAVSFDDVGIHRGPIPCSCDASRYYRWHNAPAHPTLASCVVGKWGAWCVASTGDNFRGAYSTPTPRPSAAAGVPTWLEASNGRNDEMHEGGVLFRGRVMRSVRVCICHYLLHHCLLIVVQLGDSCCDRGGYCSC